MNNPERIIQSWHENAAAWTTAVQEDKIASRKLVTNRAIVEAVLRQDVHKVLDAGCGEGWLCRELAAQGIDVTGIDVSDALIETATRMGGGTFLTLGYEAFAQNPKLAGSGYNGIVFNFSLLDADIVRVLLAARKALVPGGCVVIQTVHPFTACGDAPYEDGWREEHFTAFGALFPTPMPWYFRTMGTWLSELSEAGFVLDKLEEPLHPETGRPASLILVGR